jgi:hypothetical protein
MTAVRSAGVDSRGTLSSRFGAARQVSLARVRFIVTSGAPQTYAVSAAS